MGVDGAQPEPMNRLAWRTAAVQRSEEAFERWQRRAKLLAAWLLAVWERERARCPDGPADPGTTDTGRSADRPEEEGK